MFASCEDGHMSQHALLTSICNFIHVGSDNSQVRYGLIVCCLQGGFLGGIEGVSWLLLVAALATQAQQLMKNVSL